MLDRIIERFLEDEGLTEGLTDEDARELLSWLVGLVEEMEHPEGAYVAQLHRIGRQLARISRRYGVPIEELIDLVELAWEEPGEDPSGGARPMRA
ncbi:hypothetical protein [Marinithermus hydrothermalis]|uniref:Uncharacterized protein n=1 Tax=Marinithermus hydrothermalis (strain DSM 14884 / JCM 11576 / T1) TaxID=869210 RepID=F2NNV8_MARHT|nr:hypothetical protein [Marinithermus hydrothermalis]AEB11332.1 hypothetical protein Marky_0582 [Marinithermus hydrothermalis DSM 14884]